MTTQGEWLEYQETICSVDPSGRGSDETVACFLSQLNGFIYLHEVYASRDGYSDHTLLEILRRCKSMMRVRCSSKATWRWYCIRAI